MDVFTSRKLEGNPLAVFPDARGLSDSKMQGLASETNLQETTFVFPRDATIEREHGIKVRIFIPTEEIPFGGHPTLGTAMVLRGMWLASQKSGAAKSSDTDEITRDLKVGKVPVTFHTDSSGNTFGEVRQCLGLAILDKLIKTPAERVNHGRLYRIVQTPRSPGWYSFPSHGDPQMCRCA